MAVVVASDTFATMAQQNDITITAPSGIQSGDLLLALLCRDSFDPESFPDGYFSFSLTGFTEFLSIKSNDSDTTIQAFYRVADGTEGGSITATSSQSRTSVGFYLRLTGVDTSSPINVVGARAADTSPPITMTAVTTTVDDCLAFALFNFDGGDGDPFSLSGTGWGTTLKYQETGGLGSDHGAGWATKTVTTAGSSADVTLSNSGNNDGVMGVQFAITPSASTGYSDSFLSVSASSVSKVSNVPIASVSKISVA